MKFIWILICFIGIIGLSFFFYHAALTQSTYEGLPTVPCIDYTKPIVQNFSFTLSIQVDNKPYPLNPQIGHDYGNCLHDIFVDDSSGKVNVRANDNEQFTLGQFFDVWQKTFTPQQIFDLQTSSTHHIVVTVNGKTIDQYQNILLQPNQNIIVTYH